MQFGLNVDKEKLGGTPVRTWGARAIFKPHTAHPIDVLADRQGYAADDQNFNDELAPSRLSFLQWINQRALPKLAEIIRQREIDVRSNEVIEVSEFIYRIFASPNASHGYLYITVVELPVVNLGRGDGRDSFFTRFLVGNNDSPVNWSGNFEIPSVGDRLKVSTNWGTQTGTVQGYVVDSGWLNAMVKLDKPPTKWLAQCYDNAVDSICRRKREECRNFSAHLIEKEVERRSKLECTKTGLLPKAAGKQKVAKTALYWCAGCDIYNTIGKGEGIPV